MVAIFAGNGVGVERSSAWVLGSRGQIGDASLGRDGESLYVNAATGNLVISRQDEVLIGRGPDIAVSRTYNSQAVLGDGDNGDNWQTSAYRKIVGANGSSTVTRIDWDGSNTVYEMVSAGLYRTKDGAGAYDTLSWNGTQWLWTDGNSRITDTYDGNGRLLSTSDTDGNALAYAYDQTSGLLTRITDANGEYTDFAYYSGTNRLEKLVTQAGGQLTRIFYEYDTPGRLAKVKVNINPSDNSSVTGVNYETTYTYDGSSNRVASIAQTDGTLLEMVYTQIGADYRVTRLTQTAATGVTRVTGFFYDTPNRVTTITDPLGGVTTMSYDIAGNLTQLVLPVPTPGAAAPTTSFVYNANGDVASMTENGRTTVFTYDANGNMTLSRDSAGNTVTRTYGAKNELLTDTSYLMPDPDGAGGGAATSPVTARYAYDIENHLRFAISAEGEVMEYRYDPAGQLTSTIAFPNNTYTGAPFDETTLINWVNGIADKSNVRRTDTLYDGRGNVSTVTRYSAANSAGEGLLTDYSRDTYVYSQAGQLLDRYSNASASVEHFFYDGLGRLISSTDMAGGATTFAYNDAAATTTVTLASGLTQVSVYNRAGERISLTESGSDIVTAVTSNYYDGLGRLRMRTDPTGRSTYFLYDNASRKIADITADGAVTEYGYDSSHRLVKTISYYNKLDANQIASLAVFTAGGAGGANAGGGGAAGPYGSNFLTNGSFDTSGAYTTLATGRSNTSLPGWTKTNVENFEQVASGQMGVTGSDGAYWLDLDSIAGSGATLPTGPNLLTNGSFDTSGAYTTISTGRSNTTLPGWTKVNAETFEQVTAGQFGVTGTDGGYWLELDSVAGTGAPVQIGSNLISNGSFDQSGTYTALPHGRSNSTLPGWTKTNAENFEQVAAGQFGITGANGTYWLDLDSYVETSTRVATGANLLTNGSFESFTGAVKVEYGWVTNYMAGWTRIGPARFEVHNSTDPDVAASDGSFWLDLDSTYVGSGGSGPPPEIIGPFVPLGGGTVANQLVNGSFEWVEEGNPESGFGFYGFTLSGWENLSGVRADQIYSGEFGVDGTDGVLWLDLDGPSGAPANLDISQTLSDLIAGNAYLLQFDHANRTTGASGSFEVYWNDELIATITDTGTTMLTEEIALTAISGDNVLRFRGTGTEDQVGASLDNVRLMGESASGGGGGGPFDPLGANVRGGGGGGGGPVTSTANAEISQTIFGRTAGEIMEIRFDHANRTTAGSGSFEVYWNNALVASINSTGTTMLTKTYQVAAVAGDNTLRFVGTGAEDNVGASIDKVAVYATAPVIAGGNMDISQTISGQTAGQTMQIQFDHANRTTGASGSFQVYWNGVLLETISSTGTAMQTKTYNVVAVAGNNVLRFKGTGTVDAAGASIDNVRLFATQPDVGGGNMDISQTVSGLTAGQNMLLQFNHANRTTAASGSFEVYWNGVLVTTVTDTGTAMQSKSFNVIAIGGNNTLRFKGLGTVDAAGASIDNVRLYATYVDIGGGNMDISQTVSSLTAGQTMQLQFDHANRTSGASGSFEVYWNGALIAAINSTGATMQTKTYPVVAVAGDNVLRFKGTGTVDAAGASIDNVRLFATQSAPTPPTPAPTTDALAGLRPAQAPANDGWTWRVYDNADRLIETIDATGAATVFAYDGDSNLVSTKSYANAIAAATVTGFKTTAPTALVLPDTNSATDRTMRSIYDKDGRVVATLDGAGGLTRFEYDEAGRKIRELGSAKSVNSSLWGSDDVAAMAASAGTSAADRRVDYVYDGRGLLRFSIDATARAAEYVYDANGSVIRTISYGASITPAASYSLGYVTAQVAALAANPANRVGRTVYDAAGRATFAIDAAGAVAAFAYDNASRLIKTTAYATLYTVAGDQSLATMQSWAAGQSADPANRVSRNVYDALGRVAYNVDAENYVTEHQYDTAGRVTKDIRYAAAYTVADGVTKTSLGALIGALPADAVTTLYSYDSAGRLTDVTVDIAAGVTMVTHFTLDALGQAIDTYTAYGSADQTATHRVFDAGGRVTSETRGYNTTDAATTAFTHDRVGNLLTATDPRTNQTIRVYDTLGRVVSSRVQVDGNPANDLITSFEYDAFGNVVRVNDPRLNNSFNYYDAMGRAWLQIDAEGYATKTVYTAFGEIQTVTRYKVRPNGTPTVSTPPTLVTDPKDATTSFTYDKLGRTKTVTDAENFTESYEISAFGERWWTNSKIGGATQFGFDRLGRLSYEYAFAPVYRADGSVQQAAAHFRAIYSYDSRGNVISKIEGYALEEHRDTIYVYDKANRLIQTIYPIVAWVENDLSTVRTEAPSDYFTYDLRGNLVQSITGKTAQYAAGSKTVSYYDALNRKTAEVSAVGTLSKWTYDGNGNLTNTKVYTDPVAIPGGPGGTPPANGGTYRETGLVYDKANRLTSTSIANLRSGAFNGTNYATVANDTINLVREYDSGGNVVREYDGVGYADRYFYDKLGRTYAKVDREDFLTVWTLDAEGNAATETRYATRVASPPALGASAATLIALAGGGNSAIDRTTGFTYDRNGRRLTETRLGVAIGNIAGNQITAASADATITYTYNGLGEVTSKLAANGDLTSYEYDNAGRLIRVKEPSFTDSTGASVRRMTETFYDGLGNVVRTEVNKEGGAAVDDRVTRFEYGAGGRLTRTFDALNFERNFEYDAAGRLVKERHVRTKSDGSTAEEAIASRYDAAGRVVTQTIATKSGATWLFGEATRIRYNSFGEVSGKGITGNPNDAMVFQETYEYDGAGRLWRSNQGDGSSKIYVHDRNGAVTLTIASSGTDLSVGTATDALNLLTNNGANAVGAVAVAGVTATIFVQNRRGETTDTREPFRELSSNGAGGYNMATIVAGRTFNAFGEVATEIDARGFATGNPTAYTTEYSYNSMGRLVQKKSPSVNWTAETGAVAAARPTEDFYYDISGRLVGVSDANGNRTTRVLVGGTGMEDGEALVITEFHADGGRVDTFYNAFLEAVKVRNELFTGANTLEADETRSYDKMGRVTDIARRGGLLVDSYAYDGLGRLLRHTNNLLGTGNAERTDYDAQGRVTDSYAFGGDLTHTTYSWSATLASGTLGTFGGWIEVTTYQNGRQLTEQSDMFGHLVAKTDLGNHAFSYSYDKAARMTGQVVAGETLTYGYFNSGRTASISNGAGNSTLYGFDVVGNLVSEWTQKAYVVVQNATAVFDALNRMTSWAEVGNGTANTGSPPSSIAYEYDLVGNIRRSNSSYRSLDMNGNANGAAFTQDYWYAYDVMNRLTVEQGAPGANGVTIGRGYGTSYAYDYAGRRTLSTRIKDGVWTFAPDEANPHITITRHHDVNNTETYVFGADGTMSQVLIAQDIYEEGNYTVGTNQLRASYSYDAMQRVTDQIDWLQNGSNAGFQRHVTYNTKGQIATDVTITKRVNDLYTSSTTNYYGTGSGYDLGAVEHSVTTSSKNSTLQATITTTNAYNWWEGAVQASTTVLTDNVSGSDTNYTSTYYYSPTGQLSSVYIGDGRPRTVTMTTDMAGQILRRDEADNITSGNTSGDPHEVWYRYGGKQLGYTGNNGTLDTDYLTSIDNRMLTNGTGAFRFGSGGKTDYADFDQSVDPINSYGQGSGGGGYTVRAGDTLQSIALQVFGDQSLWYKIAEANGLSGGAALVEGQSLTLPAGILASGHSASTFKPYDAGKAMGDLSPTTPKPAKKNKCAVLGQLILAVVGAAISFILPPIAPALGPILSGALTAAVANVATQAVGVATGLQENFSWKGVAMAAIGGGVGGGLSSIGGKFGNFLNADKFASNVVKGALSNAATQGIAVATGLQDKFDWGGLAAAAATAGIEGAVRRALPGQARASYAAQDSSIKERRYQSFDNALTANAAGALAGAAARSLVNGTDFGDALVAELPKVIGRTLGNALAQELFGAEDRTIVSAEQRRELESQRGSGGGTPIRLASKDGFKSLGEYYAMAGPAALTGRLNLSALAFVDAVAAAGELSQAQQAAQGVSAAQAKVNLLMAALVNPATRGQYVVEANGRPYQIRNIALTLEEYRLAVGDGIWHLLQGRVPGQTTQGTHTTNSYGTNADQTNNVNLALNTAKALFDPILNVPGATVPDVVSDNNVRAFVADIAEITWNADLGQIPGFVFTPDIPDRNAFERYVHISRRGGDLLVTKILTGGPLGSNDVGAIDADTVAIMHTHPSIALAQPGPGDPSMVWRNRPVPAFVVGRGNLSSFGHSSSSFTLGAFRITEIGRVQNRTVWRSINTSNGNPGNPSHHPWGNWR